MEMLKYEYVKREAHPNNEQSILLQQDIEAPRKSVDRPYYLRAC